MIRFRRLSRSRRRDGGYVTVVVLTFAGLMAALVAATLNVARPSVGQALVNIDDMQADGLLEAGISTAGLALYSANRPVQSIDGFAVPLETGAIRLTIKAEAGRIDINAARPEMLSGIYAAAGTGALKPSEFAALVLDWRDRNSRVRPGGAEREEYAALGLDHRPRDGPFLSLEELLLLPGMTQEDYQRLLPYLTVFNPLGDVDPGSAEMPVLLSVPNMSESEALGIRFAFNSPDSTQRERNQLIRPYQRYLTADGSDVFRVLVEARLNNGYTKSVEAVLMPGFRRIPYHVLYWRVLDPPEVPS